MRWAAALFRWLAPGIKVKRWLALIVVGLLGVIVGTALARSGKPIDILAWGTQLLTWAFGGPPVLAGSLLLTRVTGHVLAAAGAAFTVLGFYRLAQAASSAIQPRVAGGNLLDAVYRDRFLAQGPNIVVLGGGTGLSTMLRGLKQYTSNIVAVVTVTDDGGSSGKLQRQLHIPPPGDIRNCLVALSGEESIMTDLFQFRFRTGDVAGGLRDHAFGNLLIAALSEISGGDFEKAVRLTSRVLNVRGTVLPSSLTHVGLRAEMEDGSVVDGETNLVASQLQIRRVFLNPPDAEAPDEVIEAIAQADVVVIGPGSVFTSVIPNLLVRGIAEALYKARAKKVYVCNVMTQPGETDGFSAADHVRALEAHAQFRPIVDYVMVNTDVPSGTLLNKYRQSGSVLVKDDCDRIRAMGYRTLPGNYISQTDVVRHDPARLAQAIVRLIA